jgi:predicted metalloprotease with PDZ domain
MRIGKRWVGFAILVLAHATAVSAQAEQTTTLELDATQAPTGVLHSHLTIPAVAEELTLAYPKWIPGEHAPGGPLSQVVRLKFSAGGKTLAWRRDDLDMYTFHIHLPAGVRSVEADLDFACLIGGEGFRSDVCTSNNQLVVNWWQVVLYSPEVSNDQNLVRARIHLPAGWKHSGALPIEGEQQGNWIQFKTVSLKTLVDSPLSAGEHYRAIPLGGQRPAQLDVSAETEDGLHISFDQISHFARLVAESEAIFGGPRYDHYNLLLSLGDSIDHYTLEHFQSSDNRLPARGLSDSRILLTTASMIPHEYVHSWNGKYRVPSGLDIRTYQDPMKGALVWVYEGLTDYLGNILAARSGFWSEDQLRQSLAMDAAQMAFHTGRTWRPLQDTTTGVQMLYESPNAWSSARRNTDFYPESGLIWLEADTMIREQSHGKKSIDDFCKLFYGAQNGDTPKPYSFDDVISAMNETQPYDWKAFFRERLDSTDSRPPLGGIEHSGWRLVYGEQKPELIDDMEQVHKVDLLWPEWPKWGFLDLRYSIGLLVQDDGTILDSAPEMSGYVAGITPGMQLVAVNGAKFSLAVLEQAVRHTTRGGGLKLTIANGNFQSIHVLNYHDGIKYPRLERYSSRPDLLEQIAAPRGRHEDAR